MPAAAAIRVAAEMPDDTANGFVFENVSFAWPDGRPVLKSQSFAVPAGILAVVGGPSGSGKSTLLRLMNRLEEPQVGVIYYRGRPLAEFDPPRLRKQVAYLQQMPVVPDITVRQALLMPFAYSVNKGLRPPADDELAARLDRLLLGSVALSGRAAALSVGQRQRLCLARALMTRPDVLLLDEPTASLDRESQAVVEQVAEQLCAEGVTVIMVTHDGFSPTGAPTIQINVQNGKVDIHQ
jgi:putative ABC transport system ATP-binding protein